MEVLVGIDIGTTNIKVNAFSREGEELFSASYKNQLIEINPGYDLDGEYIFSTVLKSIKDIIAEGYQPVSLGISSLGETLLPVFNSQRSKKQQDKSYQDRLANQKNKIIQNNKTTQNNKPRKCSRENTSHRQQQPGQQSGSETRITRAMIWHDSRSRPQFEAFLNKITNEEFFLETGLWPEYIYSIFKLLWYYENKPELFQAADCWLPVNSYLVYRLTGRAVMDYSLASRTGGFNLQQKDWSREIFSRLPFTSDVFPELLDCGIKAGNLKDSIKKELKKELEIEELEIDYDIPVSLAGHDHICGSYAVAGFRGDLLVDSMGTAEDILAIVDLDEVSREELLARRVNIGLHVIPGKAYIYKAFGYSGAVINSLISLFFNKPVSEIEAEDFARFNREAKRFQNSETLPEILIAQNGDNLAENEYAIDNLNILNIPLDASRGRLFLAAVRYLADKSREYIQDIEKTINRKYDVIAIGGSTKNKLLMREKARILEGELYINDIKEAVTLGAALLGGVGAGCFKDYQSAVTAITRDKHKV